MHSEISIKRNIENALNNFLEDQQSLRDTSTKLLNTLGYYSNRVGTDELDNVRFERLIDAALETANPSERLRIEDWQFFYRIMQVADDEINQQRTPDQGSLFESGGIDDALRTSYMFLTVQLAANTYTRTQLADITRFINKELDKPIMVIFRYGDVLTLAIINRRPNLREATKQVLEKVTLIKDIDLDRPKRAHIDIVSELHLHRLIENEGVRNFDTLHKAWEGILNTEPLNRKFYTELYKWYQWAVAEATLPTDEKRVLKPEEHVIRLITRLLFIWFIKEKGLVVDELFNKAQVQDLLTEDDFDNGDSYYRAVLQNLFFATLNTEIDKREFSRGNNSDHRNFSAYRYKKQMRAPDKLLKLFAKTPFINGGLFDCLDSFKATGEGGYRIDCFSDKQYHKLSIPNRLFFDENQGLIPLLEHYKFTIEENTPIEQEVALDPELLGRVFENLLAAYNPETGATVRKQTGSYYTPRAIVDYMVEEALVATLSQKCNPTDGDAKFWDERLHYLLDYAQAFDDANEWFDDAEKEAVVRAISELKILDPAVGSGAFPMGMLHKLTLALRRLDPDNSRWEKLQKERALQRAEIAFDTQDDPTRREELIEIDETFKRYRDSDFGRKLYLIQNSIFGIDIQPVACQIAKLRFFISLAIEQEPEQNAENFGIKPLPNLETRFIAANTLMGLKAQGTLTSNKARDLEQALRDNRERHFHATTRQRKRACKIRDEELRTELAAELKHFGMSDTDAERIAHWDPYDQNATADWFDSEWMFGITEGFDIVIGNPPYVRQEKIKELKPSLKKRYACYTGTADLYVYFYERGIQLLNANGIHTFICSNSWLDVNYGAPLQKHLLNNTASAVICHSEAKREFESADINTIVSIIRNGTPDADSHIRFITFTTFVGDPDIENRRESLRLYTDLKRAGTHQNKYTGDKWGGKYLRAPDIYWTILEKGKDKLVRLGDIADVRFGIKTGANEFFYLDAKRIQEWGIEAEFLKPVIKSPRECKSIRVDPNQLQFKLFMCHLDKAALSGTSALAYIEWGESQGFHQRPSCRGRARWWDLGQWGYPDMLWSDAYNVRFGCFENAGDYFADKRFFVIEFKEEDLATRAYLNSTIIPLLIETEGIANLGEGVIYTNVYWLKTLPILEESRMAKEIHQCYEKIKTREILPIFDEIHQLDRIALDAIIFDALNLTQGERDGVYEAVVNLVESRLQKAQSLRGKS